METLQSSCTGSRYRLQGTCIFLSRTSLTLAAHTSANYWDAPPTERIGSSYSDVTSCTCTPLSCPMPKTRDSTMYFISEIYNTPLFVRVTCSFCSLLPIVFKCVWSGIFPSLICTTLCPFKMWYYICAVCTCPCSTDEERRTILNVVFGKVIR